MNREPLDPTLARTTFANALAETRRGRAEGETPSAPLYARDNVRLGARDHRRVHDNDASVHANTNMVTTLLLYW